MSSTHDHIRANLYRRRSMKADGSSYVDTRRMKQYDLNESEWCTKFERLMRNRLMFGAYRYGKNFVVGKPQYDRLASIIKRAKMHVKTGNDELLVDIANLCMLEFGEGTHINKHFSSVDDGEHVKVL